jgi:hypothetical protein
MSNSATSIHEAGHAITALYCRLKVDRVTVVREGDEAGSCLVRLSGATPGIAAAVYLAGYLATRIANPYINMTASDADFAAAAKILPDEVDLNDLICKVERRLIALWPSVLRVAKVARSPRRDCWRSAN